MPWSDSPGMIYTSLTSTGLLINIKSRMLSNLVGSRWICSRWFSLMSEYPFSAKGTQCSPKECCPESIICRLIICIIREYIVLNIILAMEKYHTSVLITIWRAIRNCNTNTYQKPIGDSSISGTYVVLWYISHYAKNAHKCGICTADDAFLLYL